MPSAQPCPRDGTKGQISDRRWGWLPLTASQLSDREIAVLKSQGLLGVSDWGRTSGSTSWEGTRNVLAVDR